MQVMVTYLKSSSAAHNRVGVARREAYGTRQTVQPAGLPASSAWGSIRYSAGGACKPSVARQALAINGSEADGSYADIERRLAASEAALQVRHTKQTSPLSINEQSLKWSYLTVQCMDNVHQAVQLGPQLL